MCVCVLETKEAQIEKRARTIDDDYDTDACIENEEESRTEKKNKKKNKTRWS